MSTGENKMFVSYVDQIPVWNLMRVLPFKLCVAVSFFTYLRTL